MSSFVYQQGGSGGGGGASASIFVTGLTEESFVSAETTATRKVPNPEWVVPDSYIQLTYIKSTGTQYIDTGVIGGSSAAFEMAARLVSTNSKDNNQLFGDTKNFCSVNGGSSYFRVEGGGGSVVAFTNSPMVKWHLKVEESGAVYADGVLKGTLGSLANRGWGGSPYRNWLFYTETDGATYATHAELYMMRMWTDGVLVRNFVPAKRTSDGVLGLYDSVNAVFYTNSGSGTFVAGEEIPRYFEEPYGVLLEGKWTESGFLIAPIRNLGMWTVTATDGEYTKTQDVLVDVITQYSIEMSYRL